MSSTSSDYEWIKLFQPPTVCINEGPLSFTTDYTQSGCSMNTCDCSALFTYCNETGGECYNSDLTGDAICSGRCDFNNLGYVYMAICTILAIGVPLALSLYTLYSRFRTTERQDKIEAAKMNATDQMDFEDRLSTIHEERLSRLSSPIFVDEQDLDDDATNTILSPPAKICGLIDMAQFNEADNEKYTVVATTENQKYDLAIETASKEAITSVVFFIIFVWCLSTALCLVPFQLSRRSYSFNDAMLANPVLESRHDVLSANVHTSFDSPSKAKVEMTFVLREAPQGVTALSIEAPIEDRIVVQMMDDVPKDIPFRYNYTIRVTADDVLPIVEKFSSHFVAPGYCFQDVLCTVNPIPVQPPLVYAQFRYGGIRLPYGSARKFDVSIEYAFPPELKGRILGWSQEPRVSFWTSPLDATLDPMLIFVSVMDLVIFAMWTYRILFPWASETQKKKKKKKSWSSLLSVRKWLIVVLFFMNPMFPLASMIQRGVDLPTWLQNPKFYEISHEIQVTLTSAMFIVFIVMMLDFQRHDIALQRSFYTWKCLAGLVVALGRICFCHVVEKHYLGMVDIFLTIVNFVIIRLVGHQVSKALDLACYATSRQRQLCFRACFGMAKVVSILLMLVAMTTPSHTRISTYAPMTVHYSWLALVLTRHAFTLVLALIYLPPTCRTVVHFPTINLLEENDDATEDVGLDMENSGHSGRLSTRGTIVPSRSVVTFCLQTACDMFNLSRIGYVRNPFLYEDSHSHRHDRASKSKSKSNHSCWSIHSTVSDHGTDTHGTIFSRKSSNGIQIAVAFSGTVSKLNIKTDLNIRFTCCSFIPLDEDDPERLCQVHSGFLCAYENVRQQVLAAIQHLTVEHPASGPRECRILFTGHSLGGSLAVLAALDVALNLAHVINANIELYSFGAPRVGNHAFAELYDAQVPSSFRIVNDGDMIVSGLKGERLLSFCSPVTCFNQYKHVGQYVLLKGGKLKGGGSTASLSMKGDIVMNPSIIERTLVVRMKKSPMRHSMRSYKKRLEACVAFTQLCHETHQLEERCQVNHRSQLYVRSTSPRLTKVMPKNKSSGIIRSSDTVVTKSLSTWLRWFRPSQEKNDMMYHSF